MTGMIGFFYFTMSKFWAFLTNVRFIGGPSLLQILIASVFTALTFYLLFGVHRVKK